MSDEPKSSRRKRWGWWAAAGVFVLLLLGTAGWWLAGRRVYVDAGGTFRVAAREARLRDVVWSPPRAFAGVFNTADQEYEPAVSPDGAELYFVRGKAGGPPARNGDLYVSHRCDDAWTPPEPLTAVNTEQDDLGPRLTADGRFLLFYSNRPGGLGGYDLWAAARLSDGKGWGEPFNLGPAVNTEFNEYSPAPTPDGRRLYFATNRKAGAREQKEAWRATIRQSDTGDYDLFVAELDRLAMRDGFPAAGPTFPIGEGSILKEVPTTQGTEPSGSAAGPTSRDAAPVETPTTIPATQPASPRLVYSPALEVQVEGLNTPFHEGASCLSPVGDFLYFASNRTGGLGKFDLYRCRVRDGEPVGPVENLGPTVNTPENEADPALAVGGFHLLFSSDRDGGGGRGGYDLLASQSHEVYPERVGRGLPKLGWSWWILLGALALLIPLLMMLRGWDDRRLNLLQKCLLVSLLLHVLLTILGSLYYVSRDIVNYVRREGPIEVAVSLGESDEAAVVNEARAQLSNIPVSVAEPTESAARAETDLPLENLEPVPASDLAVPQAQAAPGAMVIPVPAARAEPVKAEMAEVKPATPEVPLPDFNVGAAQRLSQAEVRPQFEQPEIQASRTTVRDAFAPAAQAVQVPARPTAPQLASLASAAESSRPSQSPTEMPRPSPPAAAVPQVNAPQMNAQPVAAAEARPSPLPDDAPDPQRQNAAAATEVRPQLPDRDVPAASKVAQSMAQGPAPTSQPPQATESAARPAVPLAPSAVPQPQAPTAAGAAVAAAEPKLPAPTDQQADAQRQGTETAVSSSPGTVQTSVPRAEAAAQSLAVVPAAPLQPATSGATPVAVQAELPPRPVDVRVNPGPVPRLAQATTAPSPAEPQLAAARAATAPEAQPPAPAAVSMNPAPAKPAAEPTVVAVGPTTRPTTVEFARLPVPTESLPEPQLAPAASKLAVAPVAPQADAAPRAAEASVAVNRQQSAPPVATVAAAPTVETEAPAAVAQPQSLASSAPVEPRPVSESPTLLPPNRPEVAAAAPQVTMPSPAGLKAEPIRAPEVAARTESPAVPVARASVPAEPVVRPKVEVGPLAAGVVQPRDAKPQAIEVEVERGPAEIASVTIKPQLAVAAPALSAPEALFQRSPEQRKPLVEKMGGTEESESAVDRGLAYLARQQEPDGRWTHVHDDGGPGRRPRHSHDPACTGLAVLAFLAADHTPAQPGPYRDVVARGLGFLIETQEDDGDLRGPRKGGGAGSGNMYDHGIAALALAEAALMTGDPRYTEAAVKAAEFIVKAQHRQSGGWRYAPGEYGDTSVFGWQIMALHAAEQLGFELPERTREGIEKYVRTTATGRQKMLAGYQPGTGATHPMTAEMTFARVLLGERFDELQAQAVSEYLTRALPGRDSYNLYYWYYASLCLMQLQNEDWTKWNERCRETLVQMQRKQGRLDGSWDPNDRWGGEGGRIYSTAMAVLTLEVYYRYLPLTEEAQEVKPRRTPSYLQAQRQ